MRGLVLGLLVACGGVALLAVFLAFANRSLPESGAAPPVSVEVYPSNDTEHLPELPLECNHLVTSDTVAVSEGPVRVQVQILTNPNEKAIVKSITIVNSGRRRISEASYNKCANVLSNSRNKSPTTQHVRLPNHGSVSLPPSLIHSGSFFLNVLPPAGRRSVPVTYIWYLAVSVSYTGGTLVDQSYPLVMLVPRR